MLDLKKKFCNIPFRNFEVHNNGEVYSCCWVSPKNASYPTRHSMGNILTNSLEEVWNGSEAQEVRKSILDGSFKYCAKDVCPLFKNNGSGLLDKNDSRNYFWDYTQGINQDEEKYIRLNQSICDNPPTKFLLTLGNLCNFECPTCTTKKSHRPIDSIQNKFINLRTDIILKKLDTYLHQAQYIFFGSIGEPLLSKPILDWLRSRKSKDLKKLCSLEIQTNGSLFTPNFWTTLPKIIKEKIGIVQVSIDAGTKNTYENKTRLGGNWVRLNKNLDFISKLRKTIKLELNFVVQNNNFREMLEFIDMGQKLNARVRFVPVQHWNKVPKEAFLEMNVFNPSHVNHNELKKIFKNEKFKSLNIDKSFIQDFLT
jgi:MoaA/NifB/PqqE/SkfB family radical SAM enzyme